MAENDVPVSGAAGAGRLNEFRIRKAEHRGADGSCVDRHHADTQCQDQVDCICAERRNDGDGEQHIRNGILHVQKAHDDVVCALSEEACGRAENTAHDHGQHRNANADNEGNTGAKHDARKYAASIVVRAERIFHGDGAQDRIVVVVDRNAVIKRQDAGERQ